MTALLVKGLSSPEVSAMTNDIGNNAARRISLFHSQRMRFLIPILGLAFCFFASTTPMAGTAKAGQSSGQTDFHHLEGRWIRPDGGYILDLSHISGNGRVWASYFNPRRINIARADLRVRSNGAIRLFIELSDTNYPGCTYDLLYNPKTDRFSGTYFQAVQKRTYNVEFVRSK